MIQLLYQDAIKAHQRYQQAHRMYGVAMMNKRNNYNKPGEHDSTVFTELLESRPLPTYAEHTAINVNKAFADTDFNLAMHHVATKCKPEITWAVRRALHDYKEDSSEML